MDNKGQKKKPAKIIPSKSNEINMKTEIPFTAKNSSNNKTKVVRPN